MSGFAEEIEYPELEKFNGKLYTLYMLGIVGFAKKIESPVPWKFIRKFCTLYVRNVWICRKIEYPEVRKFNGKLCTLFTYGQSRFTDKLKVQNSRNSI